MNHMQCCLLIAQPQATLSKTLTQMSSFLTMQKDTGNQRQEDTTGTQLFYFFVSVQQRIVFRLKSGHWLLVIGWKMLSGTWNSLPSGPTYVLTEDNERVLILRWAYSMSLSLSSQFSWVFLIFSRIFLRRYSSMKRWNKKCRDFPQEVFFFLNEKTGKSTPIWIISILRYLFLAVHVHGKKIGRVQLVQNWPADFCQFWTSCPRLVCTKKDCAKFSITIIIFGKLTLSHLLFWHNKYYEGG